MLGRQAAIPVTKARASIAVPNLETSKPRLRPVTEDSRFRPQYRKVNPIAKRPATQRITEGGSPPGGGPGRILDVECLMVLMETVEVAGELPPGVTVPGVKVHAAALGRPLHVRPTDWSNPLEGVTATV